MRNDGIRGVRRGWRDPWFIVATIGPLVLLPLLAGGRSGEPVADDYDYLHHVLLTDHWSWFDGCGSALYWRPLARQAYFALTAPWMLDHPLIVALIHLICLCLAAALLYRTFLPALGAATALAVSTAPWMMESSRLLIAWPSCFQDLGALLFIALALHEAVAARLKAFLGAGLAALLCKEVAVVALVTVFLCPAVKFVNDRQRRTWLVSVGLLCGTWAAVYMWVYAQASLAIPGLASASVPWMSGLALVPWWSFKAMVSLSPSSGLGDILVVAGLILLTPWSRVIAVLRGDSEVRAWLLWGLAWSTPLALTLVPFYPGWEPYRFAIVSFGILAASMVVLRSLHRHALPMFIMLRLLLLDLAPGPVREVELEPPFRGASIDVPRLSRLQLFVAEVRHELHTRYPRLPHGAVVVQENFPAMTEYALGARPALHVWYRDTTLQWVPISQWMASPSMPVATVVEYQGNRGDMIALVEPEAMRSLVLATDALNSGREAESLEWLARAESAQVDTSAVVFLRSVAGKRHYALAQLKVKGGRYAEARSELLALLAIYPGDVPGRRMLARVEKTLGSSRSTP